MIQRRALQRFRQVQRPPGDGVRVVAGSVSLASGSRRMLTHSAAPPFQTGPAALGSGLGRGKAALYSVSARSSALPAMASASSRALYPSHPARAECSLTPLLLLSKPDPLRWAPVWGAAKPRFTAFPPGPGLSRRWRPCCSICTRPAGPAGKDWLFCPLRTCIWRTGRYFPG